MIKRVELNLTELCDLTCSFCPRAFDYPNKNYHMSLDIVELIADQVEMVQMAQQSAIIVVLSGRGEPTLYNKFRELAQLFLDRNIRIILFTNGKRLDEYADLVSNFTRLSYDVYSDNIEDFYKAIKQTNNLKCYRSIVQKTNNGFVANRFENGEYLLNLNNSFVENRAGQVKDFNFVFKKSCIILDHNIFIDWNGNYNLCCQDWTPTILGNIKDQDILTYFNKNLNLQSYRNGIRSGNRLSPCDVCSI